MKSIEQLAAVYGISAKSMSARLAYLGYTQVCTRCIGSGKFGPLQVNGGICFGCGGCGKQIVKITANVEKEYAARVEAGELNTFLAANEARRNAVAAVKPLVEECHIVYSVIGREYSAACDAGRPPVALFNAQGLNNSIYFDHVVRLADKVARGKANPVKAVAQVKEALEMLTQLRDAWLASKQ